MVFINTDKAAHYLTGLRMKGDKLNSSGDVPGSERLKRFLYFVIIKLKAV
jgi:hypothetical protein